VKARLGIHPPATLVEALVKLAITPDVLSVLRTMLADPTAEARGAQISNAAGLRPGTITLLLARLENAGIVTHRSIYTGGRKHYSLTPCGAEFARTTLALADETVGDS
jgi:DNA-binding MarR family transcriptional regulator